MTNSNHLKPFPLLGLAKATLRHRGRLKIGLIAIMFAGASFTQPCIAGGVFIFNQSSSHPDASAKALQYTSFNKQGEITSFRIASGQVIKITKFQPLVILPDIDPGGFEGITGNDTAAFAHTLSDYKAAYNKYPNCRPLIQNQITILEDTMRNLKAGKVWFEGVWTDSTEVERIRSQRAADIISRRQKEERKTRTQEIEKELSDLSERLNAANRRLSALMEELDELKSKHNEAMSATIETAGEFEKFLKP